jgi:hypothetical protein
MIEDFQRDGFVVLRGFLADGEIAPFRTQITALGQHVVGDDFTMAEGSVGLTPERQSILYDGLRSLPAVFRLATSPKVLDLARSLGLAIPAVMPSCNMRMDRPGDDRRLFDWHQDAVYLLGSANAVTVWVPFDRVDTDHGTIGLIPGSHTVGIHPFRKISDKPVHPQIAMVQRDLVLDPMPDGAGEILIEAEPGDVVVFSQRSLHRSHPNRSDRIRWTCQIRLADLAEREFIDDNFPMGDRTNIYFTRHADRATEPVPKTSG